MKVVAFFMGENPPILQAIRKGGHIHEHQDLLSIPGCR